jgi:hypothetical protein
MSAKLLLEVALRILGLWLLFSALPGLASSVPWFIGEAFATSGGKFHYLASTGISFIVQALLGLVALYWAPNISARFYPSDIEAPQSPIRIGPGDFYHTACFVLGVYFLVRGAVAGGQAATTALAEGSRNSATLIFVSGLVFATFGLFLVFGAGRIGQFISSIQYDPDSIPRQQFSLKLILIVTVLIAVMMGVIRVLTVGD